MGFQYRLIYSIGGPASAPEVSMYPIPIHNMVAFGLMKLQWIPYGQEVLEREFH